MSFGSSYTYRAEPVPDGLLSARKLRRGMRVIYSPN